MLKPIKSKKLRATAGRFAIIASEYNAQYVDAMVRAAKGELKRAGAKDIELLRVPGAFEIPVVAACLASAACSHAIRNTQHATRTGPLSAIVCLGVILRGETVHAAHIGEAVTRALMQIQLRYELPVIHEVLLLENEEQARVRCLGRTHNRGAEAAQTALRMARLMQRIRL
jgi:6,7-dimethyl-8-ribityllumazine synthase